jgi:hypothetical protein
MMFLSSWLEACINSFKPFQSSPLAFLETLIPSNLSLAKALVK